MDPEAYLSQLLGLIPAQYLEEEQPDSDLDEDPMAGPSTHFFKNKKPSKNEKFLMKAKAAQAKRAKLDPELNRPSVEAAEPKLPRPSASVMSTSPSQSVSVDELKAKLHSRIEELRNKRNASIHANNERQKLTKTGKPVEAARSKPAPQKLSAKKPEGTHAPSNGFVSDKGKLIFSKFDLTSRADAKKKLRNDSAENPRQKIEKLLKEKEKIEQLKKEGKVDKAVHIEENKAWKNAALRAKGETVKDDPKLLKKTLKRMEQKKAKSSREWAERQKAAKGAQDARIHKRNENIQGRKQDKAPGAKPGAGKPGPAKAGPARRPGFEGSSLRGAKSKRPTA